MSVSIRISDKMYKQAKKQASEARRTITAHVELMWEIAQAATANPDLPYAMVADIVSSLMEDEPGVPLDPEQLE